MSSDNSPSKPKEITISLHKFLSYILGPSHNPLAVTIDNTDALIIYHIDKDEEYCHVEFPSPENQLKYPRVWWINPWRADYSRVQKLKQDAAAQRLEWNRRNENAEKLARSLVKMTGIDYKVAFDTCIKLAAKKDTAAGQALKVTLDI